MSMFGTQAIEHGSSRSGRWLRDRRLRIALVIAAVEGLLYLVGALSWWLVVLFAIVTLLLWAFALRSTRSDILRQGSWILALSQAIVLLVPLAFTLLKTLAIGVVVVLAIVAVLVLLRKRP
jgi:hypothetical protein